jgi:hypothetical protein
LPSAATCNARISKRSFCNAFTRNAFQEGHPLHCTHCKRNFWRFSPVAKVLRKSRVVQPRCAQEFALRESHWSRLEVYLLGNKDEKFFEVDLA